MQSNKRYQFSDIIESELFYGKEFNSPGGSKIYDEMPLSEVSFFNKKMLELGSGLGGTALYYKDKIKEYVGVDISQDMCKIAKERHDLDFQACNILDYHKNKHDIVFSREVFMYITLSEQIKYVDHIRSLLEKDGYFMYYDLLKGDNVSEEFQKYYESRSWKLKDKNTTLKTLERDFKIVDCVDISSFYKKYLDECVENYESKKEYILARATLKKKYLMSGELKWYYILAKKKPCLILDLDNTLNDYNGFFKQIWTNRGKKLTETKDWEMHKCVPDDEYEEAKQIQSEKGFYLNVPLINSEVVSCVEFLHSKYKIKICTFVDSWEEKTAIPDKTEWLKKHLNIDPINIIFVTEENDKTFLDCDILIDDNPNVMKGKIKPENIKWKIIYYDQPYNSHISSESLIPNFAWTKKNIKKIFSLI